MTDTLARAITYLDQRGWRPRLAAAGLSHQIELYDRDDQLIRCVHVAADRHVQPALLDQVSAVCFVSDDAVEYHSSRWLKNAGNGFAG